MDFSVVVVPGLGLELEAGLLRQSQQRPGEDHGGEQAQGKDHERVTRQTP